MNLMFFYEWTFFVTAPIKIAKACNGSSRKLRYEEKVETAIISPTSLSGNLLSLVDLWGQFGGGLAFALPTSRESIATKNYFTAQGNLSFREIFNMNMTLNTAALKFFPQDAATFASPSASDDYPIGYCRGSEVRNCLLLVHLHGEALQGLKSFILIQLSAVLVVLVYLYIHAEIRRFEQKRRSLATDSNKQPVVTGRRARPNVGYLDLSYTTNEGILVMHSRVFNQLEPWMVSQFAFLSTTLFLPQIITVESILDTANNSEDFKTFDDIYPTLVIYILICLRANCGRC